VYRYIYIAQIYDSPNSKRRKRKEKHHINRWLPRCKRVSCIFFLNSLICLYISNHLSQHNFDIKYQSDWCLNFCEIITFCVIMIQLSYWILHINVEGVRYLNVDNILCILSFKKISNEVLHKDVISQMNYKLCWM